MKTDLNLVSLVKNSSWLFVAQVTSVGLAVIQSIVVARFLGVGQFGLLALITVYVTVVNQLFDCRISEAVVKYVSEFLSEESRPRVWAAIKFCYLVDLSTGILAFALVTFTAHFAAAHIIHKPEAAGLISLYALILLFATVNGTCLGVLTVFRRFSLLSFYTVAAEFIRVALVILFLLVDYGIRGIIISYIIASFAGSAILLYFAVKEVRSSVMPGRARGSLSLLKGQFGEMSKFILNTNLHESLNLFTKNIDVMILGYFRSSVEVGYYRLAKTFISGFELISGPFYTAIYPQLSAMWSEHKIDEFKGFIRRVTLFMASLSLPIGLAFFILVPYLIQYLVGAEFLRAVEPARIMLFGILIAMVFLWVRPAFLSMGRPGTLTLINLSNAVIMFAASLLIVPRLGYIGSAVMYVYPYAAIHGIAVFIYLRNIRR
jgi:O-antigen/teichoic acid export membrane protein